MSAQLLTSAPAVGTRVRVADEKFTPLFGHSVSMMMAGLRFDTPTAGIRGSEGTVVALPTPQEAGDDENLDDADGYKAFLEENNIVNVVFDFDADQNGDDQVLGFPIAWTALTEEDVRPYVAGRSLTEFPFAGDSVNVDDEDDDDVALAGLLAALMGAPDGRDDR